MSHFKLIFDNSDLYHIQHISNVESNPISIRKNTAKELARVRFGIIPQDLDPNVLDYEEIKKLYAFEIPGVKPFLSMPAGLEIKPEYISAFFKAEPINMHPRLAEAATFLFSQNAHDLFPHCENHLHHLIYDMVLCKLEDLSVQGITVFPKTKAFLQPTKDPFTFNFLAIMAQQKEHSLFESQNFSEQSCSTKPLSEVTWATFSYTVTVEQAPHYPNRFSIDDPEERLKVIGSNPRLRFFTEEVEALARILENKAKSLKKIISQEDIFPRENINNFLEDLKAALKDELKLSNEIQEFLSSCHNSNSFVDIEGICQNEISKRISPLSRLSSEEIKKPASLFIRFVSLIQKSYQQTFAALEAQHDNPSLLFTLAKLRIEEAINAIQQPLSEEKINTFAFKIQFFASNAFTYLEQSSKILANFLSSNAPRDESAFFSYLLRHFEIIYLLLSSSSNDKTLFSISESMDNIQKLPPIFCQLIKLIENISTLSEKLFELNPYAQKFWIKVLSRYSENSLVTSTEEKKSKIVMDLSLLKLAFDHNPKTNEEVQQLLAQLRAKLKAFEAEKNVERFYNIWESIPQNKQPLWINFFKQKKPALWEQLKAAIRQNEISPWDKELFEIKMQGIGASKEFSEFTAQYYALTEPEEEKQIPFLRLHLNTVYALFNLHELRGSYYPEKIKSLHKWLVTQIECEDSSQIYQKWYKFSSEIRQFWISLFRLSDLKKPSRTSSLARKFLAAYIALVRVQNEEKNFKRLRLSLSQLESNTILLQPDEYEIFHKNPYEFIKLFKDEVHELIGLLEHHGLTTYFDKDETLVDRFLSDEETKSYLLNHLIIMQNYPVLLDYIAKRLVNKDIEENDLLDSLCVTHSHFILNRFKLPFEELTHSVSTARILLFSSISRRRDLIQAIQSCSEEIFIANGFSECVLFTKLSLILSIERNEPRILRDWLSQPVSLLKTSVLSEMALRHRTKIISCLTNNAFSPFQLDFLTIGDLFELITLTVEEKEKIMKEYITIHLDILLNESTLAKFFHALKKDSQLTQLLLETIIEEPLDSPNASYTRLLKIFKLYPHLLSTIFASLDKYGKKKSFMKILVDDQHLLGNVGNVLLCFAQLNARERNAWYISSEEVQENLATALTIISIFKEPSTNISTSIQTEDLTWLLSLYEKALQQQEELIKPLFETLAVFLRNKEIQGEDLSWFGQLYQLAVTHKDLNLFRLCSYKIAEFTQGPSPETAIEWMSKLPNLFPSSSSTSTATFFNKSAKNSGSTSRPQNEFTRGKQNLG